MPGLMSRKFINSIPFSDETFISSFLYNKHVAIRATFVFFTEYEIIIQLGSNTSLQLISTIIKRKRENHFLIFRIGLKGKKHIHVRMNKRIEISMRRIIYCKSCRLNISTDISDDREIGI